MHFTCQVETISDWKKLSVFFLSTSRASISNLFTAESSIKHRIQSYRQFYASPFSSREKNMYITIAQNEICTNKKHVKCKSYFLAKVK